MKKSDVFAIFIGYATFSLFVCLLISLVVSGMWNLFIVDHFMWPKVNPTVIFWMFVICRAVHISLTTLAACDEAISKYITKKDNKDNK